MPEESQAVDSVEALESLYRAPGWVAFAGEIDHVNALYRAYIEAAPFVTISTIGAKGIDCSARGGEPGFVRVRDEKTLLLPDARGDNRLASLHNVVGDPRVGLMFLIPGCDEPLRVKGLARISTDPRLIDDFAVGGETPRTVMVIAVESVRYQCAKAIRRAQIWSPERRVARGELPGPNAILASVQWNGLKSVFRPRRAPADEA